MLDYGINNISLGSTLEDKEDVKLSNNKVGVKTREFIEEARQNLKEHKVEQKK